MLDLSLLTTRSIDWPLVHSGNPIFVGFDVNDDMI